MSATRRWWLLGLFAPAAAGQTKEQHEQAAMKLFAESISVLMKKTIGIHQNQESMFAIVKQLANRVMALEKTKSAYANGQCPQCLLIADPYILPKEDCYVDNMPKFTLSGSLPMCPEPTYNPTIKRTERMTRCARCNTYFGQDAEEKGA